MNPLNEHELYVVTHLDDRTAARALVDHLEESAGITHAAAVRYVAGVRHQSRTGQEMARAADLMRRDALDGHWLRMLVEIKAGANIADESTIFIVSGSRPPRKAAATAEASGTRWSLRAITVGARWIIRTVDAEPCFGLLLSADWQEQPS